MILNRNTIWVACKTELPKNSRPLTAIIDSLDGRHTVGAFYKDEKWYEMYTKQEIENNVICYADFEIPETYMF